MCKKGDRINPSASKKCKFIYPPVVHTVPVQKFL